MFRRRSLTSSSGTVVNYTFLTLHDTETELLNFLSRIYMQRVILFLNIMHRYVNFSVIYRVNIFSCFVFER
jgi:hypothetical protein